MNAVVPHGVLLLVALRELDARTDALDPRACDVEDAAAAALATAMLEHLRDALALMQRLQHESGRAAAAAGDGEVDADGQRPDPVGDVCFAGSFELNRVMRELVAARGADERLIAAETARRKLRRAIRAVLGAARDSDAAPHDAPHAADLAAGLAVRRLYATFRRGLRRAEDDSAEAVLVAVRYAAGALAVMVTSPAYLDVRVSDRAILRKLRERALTWARHDRSVLEGLRLLDDVWTCADLLRDINRRQELRDHDAALVQALLDQPDATAAWFARVEALAGLDDELDRLIDRGRDAPALARGALVPDVLARLTRL